MTRYLTKLTIITSLNYNYTLFKLAQNKTYRRYTKVITNQTLHDEVKTLFFFLDLEIERYVIFCIMASLVIDYYIFISNYLT